MTEVDPTIRQRGLLGILMLAVPIVAITVVAVAYAITYWVGAEGRQADGPAVRVAFQGCAEAAPLVDRRVVAMGLERLGGGPTADGFDVVTRLPADAHAAELLPRIMAMPGRFSLRGQPGDVALASEADVVTSSPEMRFLDAPHARVVLSADAFHRLEAWQQAHVDGHVEVRVEDEKVDDWKNMPPIRTAELDIDRVGGSTRDRIDLAASLPIALGSGPLPCPVTVAGVTPADVPPPAPAP